MEPVEVAQQIVLPESQIAKANISTAGETVIYEFELTAAHWQSGSYPQLRASLLPNNGAANVYIYTAEFRLVAGGCIDPSIGVIAVDINIGQMLRNIGYTGSSPAEQYKGKIYVMLEGLTACKDVQTAWYLY